MSSLNQESSLTQVNLQKSGSTPYLDAVVGDDDLIYQQSSVGSSTTDSAAQTASASATSLSPTSALAQASTQASATTIYLDPSENVGAIVSAAAAGTTFIFTPGVYNNASITPKNDDSFIGENGVTLSGSIPITGWTQSGGYWSASGFPAPGFSPGTAATGRDGLAQVPEDLYVNGVPYLRVGSLSAVGAGDFYYSNGQVYISDNPTGKTTTASSDTAAFYGDDTVGVTVENMTIEQYASYAQRGAIQAHGSSGWNVTDVDAIYNHAAGLSGGSNMTVTGGNYSNNGQEGIEDYSASNIVINGVISDNNNWAGYSSGWDAGGIKILESDGVKIENSEINNNSGVGLWFDTDNENVSILNNDISYNQSVGIQYEASQSATISGNKLAYNAQSGYITGYWGAGLLLQDSQSDTVTNNLVIANGGEGIGMQDDPRQPDTGSTIEHNTIVMLQAGANGGASDGGSDSVIFNGSNTWNSNTYVAQNAQDLVFTWNNLYWTGASTQMDPNGTYVYLTQPLTYIQPKVTISSETLAGVAVPAGGASGGNGAVTLTGASSGLTSLTIAIYDGSSLLGNASVGASGAWTYATTLGAGAHTLYAVATDSYGDSTTSASAATVTVSSNAPSVTSVSASPASGLEIPGSTIVFTMVMSAAVTVSGTPTLSLNDGGTATYTGGSGTNTLTFSNTVLTTDSDVANLAITGVNLPSGATITGNGSSANLAGAAHTFSGLAIDPPMVKTIAESPSTGDLDAGKTVTFTVTMSEAVTVSGGTPTLTLNDNGAAAYTGGSGTNTLTFAYTVGAGQNVGSLAATALNLGGATIVNAVGANAGLSLTGLAQSGPKVDTTAPTVTLVGAGGYVNKPKQAISGAVDVADAGLAVSLFDGTTQIGTATSNASTGAWSATVTLASGTNSLTARVVDGAGNSATSAAVVYKWITRSVAAYLANPSAADAQTDGVNIVDTAANVAAQFDALNADSHIATITLSDGGPLLLTAAQALNDTSAIGKLVSAPTIIVSDTSTDLNALTPAEIAALSAENIAQIDATDQSVPFALAQRQALGAGNIKLLETSSSGLTELVSYNSAGAVPSIAFSGVTGAAYTSYVAYYGANWQILSATYNDGMVKTWTYGANGAYVVSATGIPGQSYTYYTLRALANGQAVSASFSNGMKEVWTYNSDGSYQIASSGVTGAPYTSSVINYTSNGDQISGTYSNGMTKIWSYNSDGSFDSVSSNITGQLYSSFESLFDASGSVFAVAENVTDGSGYTKLYESGLITKTGASSLNISDGTDAFNANAHQVQIIDATGENSETFAFASGFGQDTIKGLVATGGTRDVIQFNTSMFTYLNTSMSQAADASALLSHAQQVGAAVTISDGASDTLTLNNVLLSTLLANPSDFHFV